MFKREGTLVYLQLIHVDVWQKPTQYCKAIILRLKIKNFLKAEIIIHQHTPGFKNNSFNSMTT